MASTLRERPGSSLLLDWLMAIAGAWVLAGLYVDGHAHVFEPVETFFTPWHALMYSGALFAVIVFTVTVVRNMRAGYQLWYSVPEGYQQTLAAVPFLALGGVLDLIWHSVNGIEQQVDTLVSPTHMIIISSMFFIFAGPLRSGLLRTRVRGLIDQLPMLISMATALATVQFVTQMAFYHEALMIDKPLPIQAGGYSQDQLTLIVVVYYRHLLGTLVVIWQSMLLVATMLYVLLRVRLFAGALLIYAVLEKALLSGSLSRSFSEFALWTLSSIGAGVVAEILYARLKPSYDRPNVIRAFAFFVPVAFYVAYFIFAVPLFGGTWWDSNFLFGSFAYAGIAGLLVAQLFIGAPGASTSRSALRSG